MGKGSGGGGEAIVVAHRGGGGGMRQGTVWVACDEARDESLSLMGHVTPVMPM